MFLFVSLLLNLIFLLGESHCFILSGGNQNLCSKFKILQENGNNNRDYEDNICNSK